MSEYRITPFERIGYRLEDIVEVRRVLLDDDANALLAEGWRVLHVGSRQWTETRHNETGGRFNATRKEVCFVLGRPAAEGG